MMMRNAGKWRTTNGTSLSIDAMAAYMNTQWDGAHDGDIVNGLNNWLGRNAFQVHGYPDYNTLRYEVLHSFETDYAPMVLEHERRGGYHPNGHSNSTFSHAIVVNAYSTSDDSVLFEIHWRLMAEHKSFGITLVHSARPICCKAWMVTPLASCLRNNI